MPLHAYITATVGPSWCIAAHDGPRVRSRYDVVLTPARYAALEERWAAEHPEALLAELAGSRELRLLRAAGLCPAASGEVRP